MAGLCIDQMLQFVPFLLVSVFNHIKRGSMFLITIFIV